MDASQKPRAINSIMQSNPSRGIAPEAGRYIPVDGDQINALTRAINQLGALLSSKRRREDLSLDELIIDVGQGKGSLYQIFPNGAAGLDLSVARTDQEVAITGGYFKFIKEVNNDPNALVSIRFNDRANDGIDFTQGASIATPFTRFFITNTAQAGKAAVFLISPEQKNVADYNSPNNQTLSAIQSILGGTGNNYGAVSVGVAAGVLVAANATQREALIFNNGTVPIYIGQDSSVTTSNGLPIPPQSFYVVSYRAVIYAISGTAAQNVRYWSIV